MKKYLADYGQTNNEKFNYQLLNAKSDKQLLDEVTQIFKLLETIPSIHVDEVRIENHEEQFGPIRNKQVFYKAVYPTRIQKIHYIVRIDGLENRIERDIFMLKLLDNNYYINEGTRYYPIWQIVPDLCVHTNNGIQLKPLAMPTTIINTAVKDFTSLKGTILKDVKCFETLAFSKSMPILIYYMGKWSSDIYARENYNNAYDVEKHINSTYPELLDLFNKYFNVHLKFDDNKDNLVEVGREVFSQPNGLSFSIPEEELNNTNGYLVVSMLLGTRNLKEKKMKKDALNFTVKDFTCPWFWINLIGSNFSRNNDIFKKFKKGTSIISSVNNLVDAKAQEIMPLSDEHKKDFYALNYWVCLNFKQLMKRDNMNIDNMRLNMYEYILYPLRVRFKTKIKQLENQSTITPDDCYKIFKSLSGMFLIQELIKSGLVHMYDATNELSLFTMTLKATFVGPAGGASHNMTLAQRDIHPSFNSKLDLVASSPGNPGVTTIILPFNKLENNKFSTKKIDK